MRFYASDLELMRESNETLYKKITAYSEAILKGSIAGITDVVDAIAHPIDNVIYPVSLLVYDAALIYISSLGASTVHGDLQEFLTHTSHCPHAHQDAHQRMQERLENICETGRILANPSDTEVIEMLSHCLDS